LGFRARTSPEQVPPLPRRTRKHLPAHPPPPDSRSPSLPLFGSRCQWVGVATVGRRQDGKLGSRILGSSLPERIRANRSWAPGPRLCRPSGLLGSSSSQYRWTLGLVLQKSIFFGSFVFWDGQNLAPFVAGKCCHPVNF
jgi:hypothetical protein